MKYSKELHDSVRRNKDGKVTFVINEGGYFKQYNIAEIAQVLLDEIERLQEEHKWIPVSERLPEMYEEINTYHRDGIGFGVFMDGMYSGLDDNGNPQAQDGEYFWTFTHWKHQEPPEEK